MPWKFAGGCRLLRAASLGGLCLLAACMPSAMSESDLLGLWHFEEVSGGKTGDSSPHANHARVTGAKSTPGARGSGLLFDGVDDVVQMRQSGSVRNPSAFTVEAWVFPMEHPNRLITWATVFSARGGEAVELSLNTEVNRFEFYLETTQGKKGIAGTTAIRLGEWHHVVGTYNGAFLKLYVDGKEEAVRGVEGAIPEADWNMQVGRKSAFLGRNFRGIIDEVALYSRAMPQRTVQKRYRTGVAAAKHAPRTQEPLPPGDTDGPERAVKALPEEPGSGEGAMPIYEPVYTGSLAISIVDSMLASPTRLKFAPGGQFLLVAQLMGEVVLYKREGEEWRRQQQPFVTLPDLNVTGERGATGLFFGAEFDPAAADPEKRDVFITYQQFMEGRFVDRIARLTFTEQDGAYIGTDALVIYEGPEPSGPAHQVQDGMGFLYEGAPHILVAFGDAFKQDAAQDPAMENRGKMLLMQREGSPPLGTRPYPEQPLVQAVGLRNPYGMLMLPPELDARRRVLGMENGHVEFDRMWLLEAVDFGHEEDAPVNLGWSGSDTDASWLSVPDANAPTHIKPEAVLKTLHHKHSPNGVTLHPGKGIIPVPSPGRAVFLVTCLGDFRTTQTEFKLVLLGIIDNLTNQPGLTLIPIIRRSEEFRGQYGSPLDVAADPLTGDIFFIDIIRGELMRAAVNPDMTPAVLDTGSWKD